MLGNPCRYDGKSKPIENVNKLENYFDLIPICPECDGGLPIPRYPSEIVGDKIVNSLGEDVTAEYTLGAELAVKTAVDNGCKIALLKARSPSCANEEIYDGSFSKTLVKGKGITAKALIDAGIKVYNETQINKLISKL